MICKHCATDKPPEAFSWKVKARGIRQTVCKPCAAAYGRSYRAVDPERTVQTNRRYYGEKREQLLEQKRAYYRRNVEQVRQKNAAYYARMREDPAFREGIGRRARVRKYGLSHEQYEALVAAQGGVCAICSKAPDRGALIVDHCHATYRIRGLLCRPCNSFLGRIEDDPATLDLIKQYLSGH